MSKEIIKACIDKTLPEDLLMVAAKKAIAENPANAPGLARASGATPVRMALLTGEKWKPGRVLRVSFLDGEPAVQAKVEQYAHQWSQYTNIQFEFSSAPDAEIRISFQQPGSWSYIGTDCLAIGRSDPTMNFGWLTPTTEDDEYSRVLLHEFGHALGCVHEHQNPAGGIPWNKEVVYRYYMGPPNNWTKEQVDINLFRQYSQTQTQYTHWDPGSIMEYPIPKQFTTDGTEVGLNKELSATDKAFIGEMYPFEAKELAIGAPPTEASIGQPGEKDLYRFTVTKEGHYVLETRGRTNVMMELFGPDNLATLVAADDDSGQGYNARIVAMLKPGTYYVRISHHRKSGTGKYAITVQAEQQTSIEVA